MKETKRSRANDEIRSLQRRIKALNAVILRVSDSLDTSVVLQEVVDGACSLTAAASGIICTIDNLGEVKDFVTCGVSEQHKTQFTEWSEGPRLFAHLRDLPGPIRVSNLPDYVQAHGFSSELIPLRTFLAMPLRHHGDLVGTFFVGEKAGGLEFTIEDEETLEVFASQAASAIANARAFESEERALADLEAVIETSPIGVAVFNGKTGRPKSLNREARRLIDNLKQDGQELEDLLQTLTCRFADGHEIDLAELPLMNAIADTEMLRAEEIIVSHPDGGSIQALANVTPIRSEGGEILSVVVTLQDLEPLEEIERQRTEFVSMVSHELRAPLAAIKGSATTVVDSTRKFSDVEVRQFFRIINTQADLMQGLIGDLLDAGRIETGTLSVYPQPCKLMDLIDQARNMFLGGDASHTLLVDAPADMVRVMADPERIVQVLVNLLTNAARHSPVSSPITVATAQEGVHISVSVIDKGPGVDPAVLPHLFRKHVVTTAGKPRRDRVTGLGLAICKGLVEAHGGRIHAENVEEGSGSRFVFTLPMISNLDSSPETQVTQTQSHRRDEQCVLVVDDDPETLRYVRNVLEGANYEVVLTGNPEDIPDLILNEQPSLVLLDLVLPGTDGIELLRSVPELSYIPVIFISGYGRDETIARALGSGAADYIVKPFSPTELCARVSAALRQRGDPETFSYRDLTIDFTTRRVSLAKRDLNLTPKEYQLLAVLSQNAGKVLTFDYLKRQVWRRRGGEDSQRVRLFIRKLRIKLEDDASNPTYIFNVHGVGYRMADPSRNGKEIID